MHNYYKKNNVIPSNNWDSASKSLTSCHLYNYCSNNPITYTDPDGRQILIEFGYRNKQSGKRVSKNYVWDNENNCFRSRFLKRVINNNSFVNDITTCIVYLKGSKYAREIIDSLSASNGKTTIVNKASCSINFDNFGNAVINFNTNEWLNLKDPWKSKNSTALNLGHEFVHAYDIVITGTYKSDLRDKNVPENFQDLSEMNAVKNTNKMAVELGEAIRTDYTTARSEKRDENSKSVTDFVNNQWRR